MHLFGKSILAFGLGCALLGANSQAAMAETSCGTDKTITIAEMTWPSAAALAHIHAIILDKGYGCDVSIVTGDTVPTTTSMSARGRPAIAPELWTATISEIWEGGLSKGSVVELGKAITDGTVEGWFIPSYVKEQHPELVTAEDLVAHPEIFPDPSNPSKGRFYSCPPGWACELSNTALFEAYNMGETWNQFSPGSGGALDASIARAFIRKQPIVFYYWGPSSVLGKYDTYQLDLGEVHPEIYACNADTSCQEKGKTNFPPSPVVVGAAKWVQEDAPVVADYFSKVGMTNAAISKILVYGEENKANAQQTAINFLKTSEETWTQWVPDDVADKVRSAVEDM